MIRDQGIKGSRGTASLADATPLFNDGLPFPVFPCFLDAGRLHAKSMSDTDLVFLSLSAVADLIRTKAASPVEVTRALLGRIDAVDPRLHGYVTVLHDRALEQARAAADEIAHGRYRGPLHGVPIAIKDLCATKGIRTTCASQIFADAVPDHDATVVAQLNAAGAVTLGKLNLTEFAYCGYHPARPAPVNPWDLRRWPGLSSSGSGAATAAGLCFASLGTDTGGSIRFPSAACGVVGLKPTYGRVSRFGVFPLADSFDHVGPITRSVTDAALVLGVIAGADAKDATSLSEPVPDYARALRLGVEGVRIGLDEAHCSVGVDPEVTGAILAAARLFAELGARMHPIRIPDALDAIEAYLPIFVAEAAVHHAQTYPARATEYGAAFRELLELGAQLRGVDHARAGVKRTEVSRHYADLFREVDLLLCPTLASAAPRVRDRSNEIDLVQASVHFTVPHDVTGNPTLSLPCGFNAAGLPLSLQLVGRHLDEALLCRAGYAYEQATPWHTRHPGL